MRHGLLICLLLALPLQAAITIEPAEPREVDRVFVTVVEVDSCPPAPVVMRSGYDISIALGAGPCLSPPIPIAHRLDLGVLPAGAYEVRVTDGGQLVETKTFVVIEVTNDVVVRPSLGPSEAGTVVQVEADVAHCGAGGDCPQPTITFDGIPAADVHVVSRTLFEATTPPHAPGVVEVRVTSGSTSKGANAFRYYDADAPPQESLFERILIPLIYNGPGAHGSQWTTEVMVEAWVPYPLQPWRAHGGVDRFPRARPVRLEVDAPQGLFLHVPREEGGNLHINALARNVTAADRDYGTEIPIARERDFETEALLLLNVPTDPRYRGSVRIYGAGPGSHLIRVVFFSMTTGARLAERFVLLEGATSDKPSFATIDAEALDRYRSEGRIGIRISPHGYPIWAFATITNNETQHVTVISPQ